MLNHFWPEFFILLVAALVGAVAVLPYSLRLIDPKKPLKMSLPKIFLLAVLQTAILSAIAIGIGLSAAHAIGLGAPTLEALLAGNASFQSIAPMLETSLLFGMAAGAILLMADLLFLPYWPEKLVETARKTTLWENFAASFYGGIDEEIFMRLFGLSALAWVLSRIVPSSAGMPSSADLWSANIVIAILFGLGHLPALKNLLGRISPVMFARSLLLNAPVGLICGWLFWTYGIEAAIVAHFSADIVYHVLGTVVLRRKLSAH